VARVSTIENRNPNTSETLRERRALRKLRELERHTVVRDAELRLDALRAELEASE
jgi:phosphotransacetylase